MFETTTTEWYVPSTWQPVVADMSKDGSTVVVGAPSDDTAASNAGKVVVFRWDGSNWNYFGDPQYGAGSNEKAGYRVAISGDGKKTMNVADHINNYQKIRIFENP